MSHLVQIDQNKFVSRDFLGFGAEWDSRNYPGIGVTDEEFALIRKRIEWMRMPVARIMMICHWCYKGNDEYDFESEQMLALYRHLDLCEERGMTVLLTDWGCEPDWLNCPDVKDISDPKYADIIVVYMKHLLDVKGYTCIKHFIMCNEPNFEVGNFDRWRNGIRNVHASLKKDGIADRVIFTGSDMVDDPKWHRMAVDQLSEQFQAYDLHLYADDWVLTENWCHGYFKQCWDYVLEKDPNGADKRWIVAEAGLELNETTDPDENFITTLDYGLGMIDFAIQGALSGADAIIAWMLDDNSHPKLPREWGMWTNRNDGMKLKHWFRAWALMTRYVPAGSKIFAGDPLLSTDIQTLVAKTPDGDWTICILNRSTETKAVTVKFAGGPSIDMARYVYGTETDSQDADGFPVPIDSRPCDLDAGIDVTCDPRTAVILTSVA
jgi:hypothetical protein